MNIKETFSLIFIIFLLSACDTGSEMMNHEDLGYTVSKIYIYNISDSSTRYITNTNGFSPITLLKSNKLLYQYSNQLWLYDFSISDSILLADNFFAFTNEYCLSPDENYFVFVEDSSLNRINIQTKESNILLKSTQLVEIPPPKYSDNGKYLLYLTNPVRKNSLINSDSVYVNIYNFNNSTSTQLDTIFKLSGNSINMGFIDNSKKVYIRQGNEGKTGGWIVKFLVYNNSSKPDLFAKRTIYSSTYDNKTWKLDENTMLVLEGSSIYQYNIISDQATVPTGFMGFWKIVRKIKKLDSLIVLGPNNTIEIRNIFGEIEEEYPLKTKEDVDWIDYSAKFKYLLFQTTKYHPQ